MKRVVGIVLAIACTVVVIVGAGFAWLRLGPRHTPAGQPALETIRADSLDAFRGTFNEAKGQVRVLALLSPT